MNELHHICYQLKSIDNTAWHKACIISRWLADEPNNIGVIMKAWRDAALIASIADWREDIQRISIILRRHDWALDKRTNKDLKSLIILLEARVRAARKELSSR